jgi:hypothetical protein
MYPGQESKEVLIDRYLGALEPLDDGFRYVEW